jgi:hypothetical protein
MNTMDMPSRFCRSARSSRIFACTVRQRRGGLVGDQHVRVVGERHGDHHPLALAAGQFVRIGVDAPGRVRMRTSSRQLDGALARVASAQAPWTVSGRASWSPIL